MNTPTDPHSRYMQAVAGEDDKLEQALTELRARQDSGEVNPAEAAMKRIQLLEAHLANCQALRREILGGDLPVDLRGWDLILKQALVDGIRYRTVWNRHRDNADQVAMFRFAGRHLL